MASQTRPAYAETVLFDGTITATGDEAERPLSFNPVHGLLVTVDISAVDTISDFDLWLETKDEDDIWYAVPVEWSQDSGNVNIYTARRNVVNNATGTGQHLAKTYPCLDKVRVSHSLTGTSVTCKVTVRPASQ